MIKYKDKKILKSILFNIICFLPVLFLALLILLLCLKIFKINTLNADQIYAELNTYLKEQKGIAINFTKNNNVPGYFYYYSRHPLYLKNEFIPLNFSADNILIYVFWGSSVVVPNFYNSFPFCLEKK